MADNLPNNFFSSSTGTAAPPISGSTATDSIPQPAQGLPNNFFSSPVEAPSSTTTQRTSEEKTPAPVGLGPNFFSSSIKRESINPLTSLSEDERKQSSRPDPENNEDEPWYSKTWDWLNKPLWDLHQYGTRTGAGSFERGVETGAEDLISGLTSPLSVALTIGTLGGDTVANLGIAGLKAVGVSSEAAPFVARGIKSLADMGFTAQALNGLVTQSPQFLDALKDGDYENAARLGTNILATGGLTALGARQTFEDAAVVKDAINGKTAGQIETLKLAKKMAGKLDEGNVIASDKARTLATDLTEQLKAANALDETTQGAIRKYMLAQGDTMLLQHQHDALSGSLPTRASDIVEQQPNPTIKDFGSKKNFDDYVANQHGGSLDNAKTALSNQFDVAQYTDESGNKVDVALKPAGEVPTKAKWNPDYVYHAVDTANADMVRNAGVGKPSKVAEYHNSPEEALQGAALPPSGNRSDLTVFAVPKTEAEAAAEKPQYVYRSRDVGEEGVPSKSHSQATFSQEEAQKYIGARGKTTGKPQELVHVDLSKLDPKDYRVMEGPNGNKWVKFNRDLDESEVGQGIPKPKKTSVMPSHEIVIDSNGKATGQVVPLRPDSPYDLTLDNHRFEDSYTKAEKDKLLAQYKAAQNLTPEQIAIANRLREFYSGQFDRANKEGIIRQAVEAYHPQAWAKDRPGFFQSLFGNALSPADNAAHNNLRHQTDNGAFDTNVNAAKHRAFETEFQGEMAGYKSKTNDLVHHAANYQNHLDRAIAARQFLDDMRASGAKASDGRPLVAMQGSSKVLGQESGNPSLLVNPNSVRGIAISNDLIKSMMQKGELEDLVNSGKIEKLPFDREIKNEAGEVAKIPAYAWSTDGYQAIDHPSMRDWNYVGKDTVGNNALLKADMRVHPEAANYVRQVVGADTSTFRTNPYLNTLMKAQRETKGALLSFSPFHAVQEALRGLMVGINPLKDAEGNWLKWNPVHVENDPLLRLGVRNNLTFPDYKAQDMFSEGVATHSKLIGKIPVANKIQNYIQEFTFEKLIPNLKARAFKSVYGRFLEKMPGASADEVAHSAAQYVNDVFGGQHWRDLGVSATGQDFMRSVALAPDWLTSEIRQLYRAAGGMGSAGATIARQDMLRLTAGVYMTARVINMLSTGKPHAEAPFGLVVPGQNGQEEKVYSLRTLPTDLVHALTDPRGFIAGRVNPLTVRTAIEGITQRNEMGQKVTPAQEVGDLARNFIPIGAQSIMKGNVPGGLTNLDQITKAAGATVYRYRTEAEKIAQEKASDHMPSGPVDPTQLAKHQRNLKLEDGIRSGEISKGFVYQHLPQREANQIIQNAGMTGLQARFNRLPLNDALDVWALATSTEKDQLHQLLWKKRLAYIQNHTPAQRADDPTWRKMQSVYADLNAQPAARPQPIAEQQSTPVPTVFRQNLNDNESMDDPDTRFNTAHHEAGHAVISEALRPGSVQGVGLDDSGGYTLASKPAGVQDTSQLNPEQIRNLVAVSYAGGMSEPGGTTAKHVGPDQARRADILTGGAANAWDNFARTLTGHTFGEDKFLAANQEQAEAKARVNALLVDPKIKARIAELATHINTKGKLTGEEVRELLKDKPVIKAQK